MTTSEEMRILMLSQSTTETNVVLIEDITGREQETKITLRKRRGGR